ncbi:biliverdin-producing heme oxygenase [Cribrihabitans neustonicus]|uniref:biliverdin-producing heme oxygenase n=1 Tax=Cribrihabitans neustonicus TaxID=1429085 RepID=UPI003B590076
MTLRTALRCGTKGEHEALDRLVSRWDLSSRGGYRNFLRMQAAALLPLEAWLEDRGAAALPPDWPARRRSQALRADLAALALPEPDPAAFAIAPCRGTVAGVLYVLEGSRLGGRLLHRMVETAPESMPKSFLEHGNGQPLWQGFLSWLEAQNLPGEEHPKAISAARSVFSLYQAKAASLLKEPSL